MDETEKEYIECDCGAKEHIFIVEYDEEYGVVMSVQCHNWRGFWSRLWTAFKYVFQIGREHNIGWDSTMIDETNCRKIQRILDIAEMRGYGTIWNPKS